MINEIAPHIYNNAMRFGGNITEEDYLIIFTGEKVLLKKSAEFEYKLPRVKALKKCIKFIDNKLNFLFQIDGISYYTLFEYESDEVSLEKEGFEYVSFQVYRNLKPEYFAFALVTARQINRWMLRNRFCGCCGNAMQKSNEERAMICLQCKNIVYPTISPAVTVAITNGDKILLARNAYGAFRKFALIAGFVEIGESFEDTVIREVMEEVGLKVKNIRYYKSQPWGSSDNEMVGFFVDLDGDDNIKIQESEIAEAKWFARDELEDNLPQISLSYEMIEKFRIGDYPR